jgi:ABC-type multidrug transport system ATPase subunit
MCDRVVIMSHGKILRAGTMAELTPRTGAVRFDLRAIPPDLEQLLAGIGHGFSAMETGFELALDEAEVDRAIDRLRAAGVGIRAITPRRLNLEESFIDVVGKEQR